MTSEKANFLSELSLMLVTIGIILNSLELVANRSIFGHSGIVGFLIRLNNSRISLKILSLATFFLHSRLFFSILLLITIILHIQSIYILFIVVFCSLYISLLKSIGGDGADQMSNIVLISLFIGKMSNNNYLILHIAMLFIAFQAILSYSTAGIMKLKSWTWRNKNVISEIINTASYGESHFGNFLQKHSFFGRICAWTVIILEIGTIGMFFYPIEFVIFLLICLFIFHLSCAAIMGLNDFVWAFSSTFPAIIYTPTILRNMIFNF